MKTLEERYKGSDTDAWKNSPIYMTGPAVLTYSVQQYLKLKVPVSGFLGTTYFVSLPPPFCSVYILNLKLLGSLICIIEHTSLPLA